MYFVPCRRNSQALPAPSLSFPSPFDLPPSLCSRSALHPLHVFQQIDFLMPPLNLYLIFDLEQNLHIGGLRGCDACNREEGLIPAVKLELHPNMQTSGAETAALLNVSQMCSSNCWFNERTERSACTMLPRLC